MFNLEWKSIALKSCRGTGPQKLCTTIAKVSMPPGKHSEPHCGRNILKISKHPWQFYLTWAKNNNKEKSLVTLPRWNTVRPTYSCFYLKEAESWPEAQYLVSSQILQKDSHLPMKKRHSNVQSSPKCQWTITKAEIIRSSRVLPRH